MRARTGSSFGLNPLIEKPGFVWQWRVENTNGSGSSAYDLNTSGVHTVYTILNEPVAPWGNAWAGGNNPSNAWATALDFVITNASCNGDGAASNALTHIAQFLHDSNSVTGHGLTYDIGTPLGDAGRPKYCIFGVFDLTGYINKSSLRWGTAGNVVNCYDQAGGLNVCARLVGISSEYIFMGYTDNNGDAAFGYILATDLVGVGLCNNPFYPTIAPTNNIPLLGGTNGTDLVWTNRSGFSNHAFARYNGRIFDACAGPHLGSEMLVQYATSSIDVTSLPERQYSPDCTTCPDGSPWVGNTNGVFEAAEVDDDLTPSDVTGIQ